MLLKLTSPIFLTGIRMFIAGFVMLVYNYFFTEASFKLRKQHIWYYAQIIICGIYLRYILRYWGLSYVSIAKLSFLESTMPLFVALFSFFAFKERLSLKKWLGFLLGFLGLVPILLTSTPAEKLVGELFFFSWPELAICASVILYAYSMLVMRWLVRDNDYSASMSNGIRMFGGGLLALLTSFAFEGYFPVTDTMQFINLLTVLIILGNVICHNLYIHLLKYYSVTFMSLTEFLCPIFGVCYGYFFFGEGITWHYLIAGALIFSGLYLFYQDELQTITKQKQNETILSDWIKLIKSRLVPRSTTRA